MFKPVDIKALPKYRLWVRYSDGVEGEVDLSHLVGRGVFSIWKDFETFQKVHIGDQGEIEWGDTVDLCPDAIYLRVSGKTADQVFPGLKPNARN